MKEIPGSIYNELREKFKKSDALNYLKELVESINENQIKEFTSIAMMDAFNKYRLKALAYMLSLNNCQDASLMVKIQTEKMMFEKESFESEKEIKVLLWMCKNFENTLILKELDNCKSYRPYDNNVSERHKELSYIVLSSKLSSDGKKEKKLKI